MTIAIGRLRPVKIETEVDIFTSGISVDPTFGEFEEELKQQDLERKVRQANKSPASGKV